MECAPPRWLPAGQPRSEKSVGARPVKSTPQTGQRRRARIRVTPPAMTIGRRCPPTLRPVRARPPGGSVGGVTNRLGTDTRPSPQVVVVLGATGDLARRKLFPCLFHLWQLGLMPEGFRIIGSSRASNATSEAFRDMVLEAVRAFRGEVGPSTWREFADHLEFATASDEDGEFTQAVQAAANELGPDAQTLFCLAIPHQRPSPLSARSASSAWQRAPRWSSRSRSAPTCRRPGNSMRRCMRCSTSDRSTGSTISWARRPCRTFWHCGSPTDCSSRCGITSTCATYRSICPRSWTSRAGRTSWKAPGPSATSSRPTCFSCSGSSRSNRRVR